MQVICLPMVDKQHPPLLTSRLRSVWNWFLLDADIREVLQGTSVALVLKVAGMGLGFLYNLILAKMLDVDDVGSYFLLASIITIAGVAGRLGLENVLVRFVAAEAAESRWDTVCQVYRSGVALSLLSATGTMVLIIALAPWIMKAIFNEPELVLPLQIMAMSIIPRSLHLLHSGALRGLKRVLEAAIVQNVSMHVVGIPGMLLLGYLFGLWGVIGSFILSSVVVLLLGRFFWWRARSEHITTAVQGFFDLRLMFRTGLPLLWVTLLMAVSTAVDTFLIGRFLDTESIGIFGIVTRLVTLTGFVLTSVDYISAPKFAALYAQGNHAALLALVRNSTFLMVVITGVPVSLFWFFPRQLLAIFGEEYIAGARLLQLLTLAQFVNVFAGTNGNLLMMTGYEKIVRNNFLLSFTIRFSLAYILIRPYGIIGVAVGTIVVQIVTNLLLSYYVYRKLSILIVPLPVWNRRTAS